MPNSSQLTTIGGIDGASFLAINTSLDVLRRNKLDISRGRIIVLDDAKSFTVVFAGEGKPLSRAQLAVRQSVELSPSELDTLTDDAKFKVVDEIDGGAFLAIQVAANVFERRHPDLRQYRITVVREGSSVTVIFADKSAPHGGRGNPGALRGFEVEMDARNLQVRRSNFIR